jgi:hypothetical protein
MRALDNPKQLTRSEPFALHKVLKVHRQVPVSVPQRAQWLPVVPSWRTTIATPRARGSAAAVG